MRPSIIVAVLILSTLASAQPGATGVATTREQISELKEKVLLSKERLRSLELLALGGTFTAPRFQINHRNDLGAGFELESLAYTLDGAKLATRYDATPALDRDSPISLFDGRLLPGHHLLTGRLVYRGTGFGHVFKYLEGYKFTVESSCVFEAVPGQPHTIELIGYDRGGFDFLQRPGLKCSVH